VTLELGRLFHLWGRRAVVSVGVCMVIDLQLLPRSNPTKSPDNDRHRSFISTRCSRCCPWAREGVGVTREDVHVQGCWYIGPLCRLGSDGHADLVSISWGSIRKAHHHRRDWRTIPRQDRTMMAGCCVMSLFQQSLIRHPRVSRIWM
jgi:hypothetical protein